MNKKILLWIIGILLLTGFVFYTGIDGLKEVLLAVDLYILIPFLILMVLLQIITLLLTTYQWHNLLGKQLPFAEVFMIFLAGNFVESVTPSSKLGGEAVKVYLFKQKTNLSYQGLTTTLLAHKYVSLIPFLFICGISLLAASITYNLPSAVYVSFILLTSIIITMIVLVHSSWGKDDQKNNYPFPKKILSAVDFLRTAAAEVKQTLSKKARNELFLISLVVWGMYPVKIYLTAYVLNIAVSITLAIMITYIAYMVSMLPITPGGLGTFEGSMAVILSLNGFLFSEGMAIALLARSIRYWFPLVLSTGAAMHLIKKGDVKMPFSLTSVSGALRT